MYNPIESQQFVDESTVSYRSIAIKYGAIAAISTAAIGLVMYLADLVDPANNTIPSIINGLIFIAAIVLAVKDHKNDDLQGVISYKRAFSVGALVSVVVAILGAVWAYIFMAFIAPDMVDMIRDVQMQTMAEKGMAEEEIEQAMEMTKGFMSPGAMAIMSIFMNLIMGAIVAAVVAAIMKNKPALA